MTAPYLTAPVPVTVEAPAAAFTNVLAHAGASLHWDPVDARLIAEVSSLGKLGKISHTEAEAGGIGELRTGKQVFDAAKFKNAADLEAFLNGLVR